VNSTLPSIPLDFYLMNQSQDASNAAVRTLPATPTLKGIVCSVQPMSAIERDNYNRRQIVGDWKIYTNYNFDGGSTGAPRLGWQVKDPATGWVYQVKGVERSASGRLRLNLLYKLICVRLIPTASGA
jgi:hypothetical protein